MSALGGVPKEKIRDVLEGHMSNGIPHVPKEYGMFIAS